MQIDAPMPEERQANRAFMPWLILVVLLLFSIAAPLNQFKVPPIIPVLMTSLGLSVSGAGMLMSVYAVTGLILAIPSGFILQRVGFRITGLIAGGSIVIGSVLGALSATTGTLLVSRVIEGAGTGFMAVLAPALIAQWFVASRRGTAMGIWSAWVPIGSAVTLIVAPPLAQAYGWRAVWWFGAIYALAVTVLYLVVVRPAPLDGVPAPADGHPAGASVSSKQVLRNRNIWLLAAAFAGFIAVVIGSSTYLPTFLATKRGIPLSQAALLAAIPTLVTIFSAPGGGILSDRIGSRKKPYLVGIALAIVLAAACLGRDGPRPGCGPGRHRPGFSGSSRWRSFPPRSRLPATSDRVGWPWRSLWWAKTRACCWDRSSLVHWRSRPAGPRLLPALP